MSSAGRTCGTAAPRCAGGRDARPTHGRDAHATCGIPSIGIPGCGRAAPGSAGFTLVEMMVVLVLMAVLLTMAVPRYAGSIASSSLRQSARRLLVSAQYARNYAVTHRTPTRLRLDGKNGQFIVESASTDREKSGQFEPAAGPCRRQVLGKGVRFSPPRIESARPVQAEEADSVVQFEPSGQADAAVLEVTDGNVCYSVIVVPESGRAILVWGKVQELPNDRQDLDAQR